MELSGLILSGGKSSRMGQDKAGLSYRNQAFLEKAIQLASQRCSRVFISSSHEHHVVPGVTRIPDAYPSDGPLSGLVSALEFYAAEAWLVLAVDLPLLRSDSLDLLLQLAHPEKVTAYSIAGLPDPLFAIYPKASFAAIQAYYQAGKRKMRGLLMELHYHEIKAEDYPALSLPEQLHNVNRPDDIHW